MRLSRRSFLLGSGAALAGCESGASSSPVGGLMASLDRKGATAEVRRVVRSAEPPYAPRKLLAMRERLKVLHLPTTAPKPGEWRSDHPEPGQSFEEYLRSSPTVPAGERRSIVVQPLGELTKASSQIVQLVGEFLSAHFGLPVRTEARVDLGVPPAWAHRVRFGAEQYLTQWLLKDVLPSHLPKDAMAVVGFLETDLWPGENWNYVFGEATLADRVGVWSLHRYGDPSQSEDSFKLALRRALKIAAHETGHMFSLHHCTAYRCLQAGVNSLEEADASPLSLCPDCLAKIAWVTSTDPKKHLRRVGDFCRVHALTEEADFFIRSLDVLS